MLAASGRPKSDAASTATGGPRQGKATREVPSDLLFRASAPMFGEFNGAIDNRPEVVRVRHFEAVDLDLGKIGVELPLAVAGRDPVVERLGIGEQLALVAIGRQVPSVAHHLDDLADPAHFVGHRLFSDMSTDMVRIKLIPVAEKKPKPLKTLARVQKSITAREREFWGTAQRPSERSNAHEIVKIHDSNHLAALDDQKRLDLVADLLERFRHQRIRRDGARAPGHDDADGGVEGEIRLQVTAQMPICDDAGEAAAILEYGDAAQTLQPHSAHPLA